MNDVSGSVCGLGGTRQRIVDVSRRLFSDGGYLGVSMSDIADYLGLTKATLYHHFTGKAAIYGAVLDDVFTDLRTRVADALGQASSGEQLRRLIENYLDYGMVERNLVNTVVAKLPAAERNLRQRVAAFREELIDEVQPVVERNLVGVDSRKIGDGRLAASLLICTMDGLLLEYALFDKAIDSSEVAGQIAVMLGLSGRTCAQE